MSVQKVLNYPFLQVDYGKSSLVIEDLNHRYEFNALTNTETIRIGRDLTLIDNESDGNVDVVKFRGDEYQRGEGNAEGLFRSADARWATVREYMLASWFRSRRDEMIRRDRGAAVKELQ
jgi:hypothetical protein